MTGQDFERSMVHAFNDYAGLYNQKLVAYRHVQMRFQPQLWDVLVDSRFNEFYLALECKSINPDTVDKLYFKKAFNWKNGECQIVRETDWLKRSGRNGFLVVELRRAKQYGTSAFFVPWRVVEHAFNSGRPAIEQEQITFAPSLKKRGGKYTMDDDFVSDIVKQLDSYPKDAKKAYKPKGRVKSAWTKSAI